MRHHGLMAPDPNQLDAVREALDAAVDKDAGEALPHLREAADRLTALIDESMAEALLAGKVSLRSAGAAAGLTENAVPPRLARTQTLGAYANEAGRVTAGRRRRASPPAIRTPKPHPHPPRVDAVRTRPPGSGARRDAERQSEGDLTRLCFLLDRGGSIQVDGVATSRAASRRSRGAAQGRRRSASLSQFDDVYEVVYANRPSPTYRRSTCSRAT